MSDNYTNGTEQARLGSRPDVNTRVGHVKKDSTDAYIGRADGGDATMMNTPTGKRGWLGNPFQVDKHGRVQCVDRFRDEFEARLEHDDEFRDAVTQLQGKILGCWCQRINDDGPLCHGEVIAEHAERLARSQDYVRGNADERVDDSEVDL